MNDYPETAEIQKLINNAEHIVIMQADNPDGDSLGSALALEEIIGDLGKQPYLYCGSDIPAYLHYLPGWDRVSKELPDRFDLAIIVDTVAMSLFDNLQRSGSMNHLQTKPVIILDHHGGEVSIPFARVVCNKPVVATGQLIYELSHQCDWPLNLAAKRVLVSAIMADSLGLTVAATSARTFHIVGEMVEDGVDIALLEQQRRELGRRPTELIHYKGELLQRVEFYADDRIATITIPWQEIKTYSVLYNPPMLVLDDMRNTTSTAVAIAFKLYSDGHVTAKIRSNYGYPVAAQLAERFGGGGHAYASGFKMEDGRPFGDIKTECIRYTTELLDNLDKENTHEAVQHTDS
ncbi:MAG TPA: DHH family phosphoesterase [Candidatus Saccharimonadales bacterium]|nr:DHH family phosphoesterase [Candidatus Saccharimonadales bacterium]